MTVLPGDPSEEVRPPGWNLGPRLPEATPPYERLQKRYVMRPRTTTAMAMTIPAMPPPDKPAGGDVKGAIAVPGGPLVLVMLVITGAVTTA